MFSCILNCCLFAKKKFVALCFSHIHSYLNILILLITKALVKGWLAVKTIAPLSLIILLYCSQSGSKGMMVSHLQAVVPYSQGRSAKIISTDLSAIFCISSRQSP